MASKTVHSPFKVNRLVLYWSENEVLNHSVYIKYGFLAIIEVSKNLIRHVLY